jgi:hypothetical protein
MDFMNRGTRPSQQTGNGTAAMGAAPDMSHRRRGKGFMGLKVASVALLFSATILVVALLWFVVLGSPSSEAKHVEKNKLQAVFLSGGQVYFGNIQDLNDSFLRISNIYYLRVNQQVQPDQENSNAAASANDISLVKLGCELHGPTDEMLVNRDQVIFWENLKDDGQVAKAVAEYVKQNPNGQQCTTQSTTDTNNSNQ